MSRTLRNMVRFQPEEVHYHFFGRAWLVRWLEIGMEMEPEASDELYRLFVACGRG